MAETMDEMELRHESERAALQETIKSLMKGAKKSERAVVEARCIQMEYDLKAQHIEEIDTLTELFESNGGVLPDGATVDRVPATAAAAAAAPPSTHSSSALSSAADQVAAKKAKAQRKKDKRGAKEVEKEAEKAQLIAAQQAAGPSARQLEIQAVSASLRARGFAIKDIPADGNCLYRAVADQMNQINSNGEEATQQQQVTFTSIRRQAGQYIRGHADEFAPFLGLEAGTEEFDTYCTRVEDETHAEWGGQVELRAISCCLGRSIHVYSAEAPLVEMHADGDSYGDSYGGLDERQPIRLAYHRHYYALGEHYNSVVPL